MFLELLIVTAQSAILQKFFNNYRTGCWFCPYKIYQEYENINSFLILGGTDLLLLDYLSTINLN